MEKIKVLIFILNKNTKKYELMELNSNLSYHNLRFKQAIILNGREMINKDNVS